MLKRYISLKLAANGLLVALGLFFLSQLLALLGFSPVAPKTDGAATGIDPRLILIQLGVFVITLLMVLMVAVRIGYIRIPRLQPFSHSAMWVIFVYFLLNTAGTLSSANLVGKLIFVPIGVMLAVFAYRLAMEEDK